MSITLLMIDPGCPFRLEPHWIRLPMAGKARTGYTAAIGRYDLLAYQSGPAPLKLADPEIGRMFESVNEAKRETKDGLTP